MDRFNTMEETGLDFLAARLDQIEDILTWERSGDRPFLLEQMK